MTVKIYFDESGQSGCVSRKAELLNFKKQPTFALAAVVCDENDEQILLEKYKAFKRKYDIQGELKGNELLMKENNKKLDYFVRHILDDVHFYVIIYDKRFYLSTLLLLSLIGFEYKNRAPVDFYQQAALLTRQSDDFFLTYLKYTENPNVESFLDYLNYLINYEYENWEAPEHAVKYAANKILTENSAEHFYDDFMTYGWYENSTITNLINLNALSELIYFIKDDIDIYNNDITYIHDNIREFESTFKNELEDYGIEIHFADSKQEDLLQIADNTVSVVRKAYDKMIEHYKAETVWDEESSWNMKLASKVVKSISSNHINFTVPICDWAATLCTQEMFDINYPKKQRNKACFNFCYIEKVNRITWWLLQTSRIVDNSENILTR